jgi:tyrosine-protein phosphatase SIW14
MSVRTPGLFTLLILGVPAWAAPASVPGIKNFHQVDQQLYRGAQPAKEGIEYLAKLGVKVVLDLREPGERSRAEERTVVAAGMRYVSVPMTGLTAPTQNQTTAILRLLEDEKTGPVFVHCMRGADRTGAVVAAYRIDHDKWDNARALKEALANGMSWFQFPRQNFIKTFRGGLTEAADTKPTVAVSEGRN